VQSKSRPEYVGLIIAAAIVGAGVALVAHGVHKGIVTLTAARLIALSLGTVISGVTVLLVRRARRHRARVEAIRTLLPQYRARHHLWAMTAEEMEGADPYSFDDADEDDTSRGVPVARAEFRAVTRALLMSLEEEMRRETGRHRRTGRPACRRARLRAAGRSEPRRRRVPVRPATILS
jgi:hypothetical protein